MSNMLQVQQKIIFIAQQSQEQNDTHYIIAQEDKGNFKQTHFPINSFVLVEYETRKDSIILHHSLACFSPNTKAPCT